jgi:hypothetical protein
MPFREFPRCYSLLHDELTVFVNPSGNSRKLQERS